MEQLGEPLDINRRFIKLMEEVIEPAYNKTLQDIFEQLTKEIDEKYSTTESESNKDT